MDNIDKIIEDFEKESDIEKKADLYKNLLNVLYDKGKFTSALRVSKDFYHESVKTDDKKKQIIALINIAIAYFYLNDNERSIENNLKAVNICHEINETKSVGDIYNSMAGVYYRSGEIDKAVEYLVKARDIFQKSDDKRTLIPIYLNLARIYKEKRKLDEAMTSLDKMVEISNETKFQKPSLEVIYFINLSEIYLERNEIQKALETISLAESKAILLENKIQIANAKKTKAVILAKSNKNEEANEILNDLLSICEKEGLEELKQFTLYSLYELQYYQKKFEESLFHLKEYINLFKTNEEKKIETETAVLEAKFDAIICDKEKEIFRLRNIELKDTLKRINRACSEIEKNQIMKIQKSNLGVFLGTTLRASEDIHLPLQRIIDNIQKLYKNCGEQENLQAHFERIFQNINRISLVTKKFSQIKDLKIKKYTDGVKMVEIETDDKDI